MFCMSVGVVLAHQKLSVLMISSGPCVRDPCLILSPLLTCSHIESMNLRGLSTQNTD